MYVLFDTDPLGDLFHFLFHFNPLATRNLEVFVNATSTKLLYLNPLGIISAFKAYSHLTDWQHNIDARIVGKRFSIISPDEELLTDT